MTFELIPRGGLGNQIFQSLMALYLAEQFQGEISINKCWFNSQSQLRHKIDGYRVLEIPSLELFGDCKIVDIPRKAIIGLSEINNVNILKYAGIVTDLNYKDAIHLKVNPKFVNGYFQNQDIIDKLNFKFSNILRPTEVSNLFSEFLMKISSEKAIGIHLRLGDYLHDKHFNHLDESFVLKAISYILNSSPSKRNIYVATDSPSLLRVYYPSLSEYDYQVLPAREFSSIESIHLLAACKDLILSASTFSWWAGVLAEESGSNVFAPISQQSGHAFFKKSLIRGSWISLTSEG